MIKDVVVILLPVLVSLGIGWLVGRRGQRDRARQRPSKAVGERRRVFNASIVVMVTIAVAIVGWLAYEVLFRWPSQANDAAAYGQRGDYFGGFANPLLTFITFFGFIYALFLQREDLSASRTQFERSADALANQTDIFRNQNYQAGVFELLGVHNDIVGAVTARDSAKEDEEVRGRQAFRVFYSSVRRLYREKRKKFPAASKLHAIQFAYGSVYRDNQHELGHYYRFLFNMFKVVEDGPESRRYIKLVRAQISNQELLMLYYNCAVAPQGRKFREIAVRHALFDNMPPHLLDEEHAKLLGDEGAFGEGGYRRLVAEARAPVRGDLQPTKEIDREGAELIT